MAKDKKIKNNLITIEEVKNIIGKGLSTTRKYKNWGLFIARDKDGRLEKFNKDEAEKAWKMFKDYILKPEYNNNVQKACEDIGKQLYS